MDHPYSTSLKKTNHCYDDDIRATAATGTTCPDQGAQILRRNCAGKRWWEIQDSIKSSLSLWARHFTWQISLRSSLVSTHTHIYPTYSRILVIFGKSLVVIFSDAVKRYNYIHMHMLCTYVYIYNTKQKKTAAITSQSCALQPALHILPLWMPEGHRCWPKSQRCSQRHSLWQSNDQHIWDATWPT